MAKANFSVKDFRSTVFTDSLARTNRFEVFIAKPPMALSTGRPWNVSLYCEQASLPPLNIASKSFKIDRKSTRLNSSHSQQSRMPSSA